MSDIIIYCFAVRVKLLCKYDVLNNIKKYQIYVEKNAIIGYNVDIKKYRQGDF